MEDEEFLDYEECSLSDLFSIELKNLEEGVSYHIFENNFPECHILRKRDNLLIQIEEHIYTKYWFHKYHALVFAEAMIKAIKRLRTEGIALMDEEIDNEDEVHIFIRWSFNATINTNQDSLKAKINLAYDLVFERANNMLENSDSVLILGKDTEEGLVLLKTIQSYLDDLGFYTYLIKEEPDKIGESVMQKVLRYGLSSKFVVIENSEPSGHLYELPHIAKFAELTTIVLQKKGVGATWMFEDLYPRLKNIQKFEYEDADLGQQINAGIEWANNYFESFSDYQKRILPWFKS
ncbi:MAG: hypothetical protein EZS26_002516 [Candidatus Ordinivivax streblomastigis]|uniref:Uncharacterized protein n=1 Tax=Candidatus Ordinivivax streblomastigis TaxID=2540710 RepID=A0A5M8NYU7_9BACT|nr:MAG: hypothetical protein EZS26_002516 [Candidatus Ordinivivax streblomastigis]